MKTKIFHTLAVLGILCTSCTTEDFVSKIESRSSLQKQIESIRAYETFYEHCMSVRSSETVFPSFYGGAYLNDAGSLIINLTDDSEVNRSAIISLLETDNVIFKKCDFSHDELSSIRAIIDEYLIKYSGTDALKNISSSYLDECNNRVVVQLLSCTDTDVQTFEGNVCKSAAITFEQVKPNIEQTNKIALSTRNKSRVIGDNSSTSLSAGGEIWNDADTMLLASVGYRATDTNGYSGFVSSGHIFKQLGGRANIRSTFSINTVGTCTQRQTSENIDAAFCRLLSGVAISNTLTYNSTTYTYTTTTPVSILTGTRVFMYGAKTLDATGAESAGQILSTNCSFVFGGTQTYTGMVMASYPARIEGDEGGLVVARVGLTRNMQIYGIHIGAPMSGISSNGIVLTSYFVPASIINNTFGLTIY